MKKTASTIPEEFLELDKDRARELIRSNCFASLAYQAHGNPYVLPITYYFDAKNDTLISYSMEGHKIDAMRRQPEVAVLVYEMLAPDSWRSVQVHGLFEEIRQIDAKACLHRFTEGVRDILRARGEEDVAFIPDFSSKSQEEGIPVVYRIRITHWIGRSRNV